MNSKISIFCFTLFLHMNLAALSTWNLVVNDTELECQGHKDDRYWLCSGSFYSGVVDREPTNSILSFLLLLVSDEGMELNLIIKSWNDESSVKRQVSGNNEDGYLVSHLDYIKFYETGLERELFDASMQSEFMATRVNDRDCIFQFLSAFYLTLGSLRTCEAYQHVYEEDGCITSSFVTNKPRIKKNASQPIVVKKELPPEYVDQYTKITVATGREPNLAEATFVFERIAQRKDIPFAYEDGCFARSHVIACELHLEGYRSGKIWVVGDLQHPHHFGINWSFHVAPLIYVRDDENNIAEPFVIDPLVDKNNLLPVGDWLRRYFFGNPQRIAFPIPDDAIFYENAVVAFSSHVPTDAYFYDGADSLLDTMARAYEINAEHLQILALRN